MYNLFTKSEIIVSLQLSKYNVHLNLSKDYIVPKMGVRNYVKVFELLEFDCFRSNQTFKP